LGREVAIKVLPSFFSSDPERLRRFEQEARAAAALNHPNILAVFQMGNYEGAPYLVSELLEGETLRTRLQHGPLRVRKVVDYAGQIVRGLAAAHEKGIVHRDLKPENLFLARDGRAKILDFGLAKLSRPGEAGVSAAATLDCESWLSRNRHRRGSKGKGVPISTAELPACSSRRATASRYAAAT
jgi:serine/threonine protein kinase